MGSIVKCNTLDHSEDGWSARVVSQQLSVAAVAAVAAVEAGYPSFCIRQFESPQG